MPTYVSLLNFTDQGIRTVRDTLERMESAAGVAESTEQGWYRTTGPLAPTTLS